MEKYGFIYIWFDKKRKMYYIGSHWGTKNDQYICSSNTMRKAFRRRSDEFKRRIVKKVYTNRKDTFTEEQRYLDMIKPEELGARYYNISPFAKNHWSSYEEKRVHVAKVNSNISKALHNDPAYRKKYEKGLKTRITTEWSDPVARGLKIAETKRQRFQEKRDRGLPSFEGQAAENLRIGNAKKRGRPSPRKGTKQPSCIGDLNPSRRPEVRALIAEKKREWWAQRKAR